LREDRLTVGQSSLSPTYAVYAGNPGLGGVRTKRVLGAVSTINHQNVLAIIIVIRGCT